MPVDPNEVSSSPTAIGSVSNQTATVAASAATFTTDGLTPSVAFGSLRFPDDLDVIDHWMDITVFEYSRANRSSAATKKAILGHITLPVPPKLSTGYSQDYENAAMGLIEHAAMSASRAIVGKNNDDLGSISDKLSAETTSQLKSSMGLATGYALDQVPGAGGAQLQLGMARNPHFAVLYKGPKFRTHQFTWTFNPRTQAESQTLQNIIYSLKYSQAPDISASFQNHLFKYPDEMEIKFHYPQYLFSIGPSVLTDITVEYHGERPAYFQTTHAPVQVSLSLSFQETTILTKQSIANDKR